MQNCGQSLSARFQAGESVCSLWLRAVPGNADPAAGLGRASCQHSSPGSGGPRTGWDAAELPAGAQRALKRCSEYSVCCPEALGVRFELKSITAPLSSSVSRLRGTAGEEKSILLPKITAGHSTLCLPRAFSLLLETSQTQPGW